MSIRLYNKKIFTVDNRGKLIPNYANQSKFNPEALIWIAHAEFNNAVYSANPTCKSKQNSYNAQKLAVRLLLVKLISQCAINLTQLKDELLLNDTSYPYRLNILDYYVSFTHSQSYVSCAISRNKPVGIDTEVKSISQQNATRFFNPLEIKWLDTLEPEMRDVARRLLWSIKEAYIKKMGIDNLFEGLHINHTDVARNLLMTQIYVQQNLNEFQDEIDNLITKHLTWHYMCDLQLVVVY